MKPKPKICWIGYKDGECPKRRLENEKLIYGALLVLTIGVLVFCNLSH